MRSNTCDSGSTESAVSPGPTEKSLSASTTFETRLAWVRITPFGVPVVPDV
jgi:hypothetical protein